MRRALGRLRDCQSGTTAIEFAIIGPLLISLAIGTVEFGRGLLIRNELAYAMDRAVRMALIDPSVTEAVIETTFRGALTSADVELVAVAFGAETVDSTAFRTMQVTYPLELLIPGLIGQAIEVSVDRRIPVL